MTIRKICFPLNASAIVLLVVGFFSYSILQASPNLMTFQSRIVQPNGQALEGAAVSFRFSVTDALGTCVIYQEDFPNRNMSGSKGLINLTLGGGSKVYPAGAMALTEVFNNYNFPTFNCQAGGTVNAGATDRRRLVMQFNDGSGWQTVPAMDINSNPFAMQATTAHNLGDYPAADYLRTATMPTCGLAEALHFNGTTITCVTAGGAGAGTVTNVTSANADIGVATGGTTPVLTLNAATTGADKILRLKNDGTLDAISGVNLTNLNATSLASGTVPAARFPALTGEVTTVAGNVATTIAANAITSAKILDDEIVDADIKSNAAIARTKIAAESAGNGPGNVLINDGSGNIASLQCNNGEVIKFDGAGVAICGTDTAGAGDIINGGNTTGSAVTLGTNDAQSLVLETNNAPALTILNGGNVGIGTAAPASKLEVVGSSTIRNDGVAVQYVRSYSGGTSGRPVLSFVSKRGTFAAPSDTLNGDKLGEIGFGDGSNVGAQIMAFASEDFINGNAASGGNLRFYTVPIGINNAAERMRIDAAGSVGIGTSSPQRLLHIAGPMRITPTAVPAAAAAGDMYVDSGDSNKLKVYDGGAWVAAGGGGAGTVTNVSSANADIGVATGGSTPVLTLNAATTGADKILRLKNDGTLDAISGVNLTNLNATALTSGTIPAARFPALTGEVTTVAGNVATTISANAVTSAKILDDEIVDADIKSNAAITRTKIALGSAGHVLINSSGGVMTSEAQLSPSRGGTGLSSYTNNALIMANGTGTALTNATCNIGEILMWNATAWACTNMAASAQGYFKDGGNTFTGTATIGTNSNHNLQFETNGSTKMTLDASGNLILGTGGAGSKLNVYGTSLLDGLVNVGASSTGQINVNDAFGSSNGALNFTAAADGDPISNSITIGAINFKSFTGATFVTTATVSAVSEELHGVAALGTSLRFSTTPSGSAVKSEKMRIAPNGNVGIGTTGPSAKLEVAASADTIAIQSTGYSLTGANTSSLMNLTGVWNTTGAPTLLKANVTNTASSPASLLLDLQVSGSSLFRVNKFGGIENADGATFNTNGNIFKGLEIYNANAGAGAIAGIRLTNDNFTSGSIGVRSSAHAYGDQLHFESTGMVFDSNGTTKINFRTNSTDRVLIDTNGYVGIGTTSPQRLLHVAGPMRITPTVVPAAPAAGDMYVDSADSNKLKIYDGGAWIAAGGGGAGTVTNVSSANADIGVATGGSTPVLTLNAATTGADKILRLKNDGTLDAISGVNLTNLNATALTSGTVPAARFPALTGEVTTVAGNVATTIAANAITSAKILDDEIVDADIKSNAAIARSKLASGTNDHVLINSGAGVMSSEAQLAVSRGGTGLGSYTNNALIMANGTGTALTNATCNVGEILMWNATTWACTNMAASAQGYFKDGGNTFTGAATIGTNSNHNLEIETNGTTKMTVLANGNVGIGTAAPNHKLHLHSTGTTIGFQITSAATGATASDGAAIAWDDSVGFLFGVYENAPIVFNTGGTEKIRVDSSGRLGVGIINPGTTISGTIASTSKVIEVSGDGSASADAFGAMMMSNNRATATTGDTVGVLLFSSKNNAGNPPVQITGTLSGAGGANGFGGYLSFNTKPDNVTANSERMRIDSAGNVGIGTTTPAQPLEVNGNVRIGSQTTRTTSTNRGQLGLGSTYVVTVNANTTVDWDKGNIQELNTFLCDGAKTITMSNLRDGAAYTLLLSGTAVHSGTCLFSSGGFTFKTSGGNVAPTASKDVLFTFAVINNIVVYSMMDNLQ